jgi:hypothetical protein
MHQAPTLWSQEKKMPVFALTTRISGSIERIDRLRDVDAPIRREDSRVLAVLGSLRSVISQLVNAAAAVTVKV